MNRYSDKIKGWNWAAFLLTWIWGVPHRVWISLFGLLPGVNLLMAIFLGLKGNELAWKKNHEFSAAEFKSNQKLWLKWAIMFYFAAIFFGTTVLLIAAYAIHQSDEMSKRDALRISRVRSLIAAANGYKADNEAKCPDSLFTLVPLYIDTIPTDLDGKAFAYSTDGVECVISVPLENSMDSILDDANPNNGKILDFEIKESSNTIFFEE